MSLGNWSNGWIYYSILAGEQHFSSSNDNEKGCYIPGSDHGKAYGVTINERYVVESNGDIPLVFRLLPYRTAPTYKNIILTATKVE